MSARHIKGPKGHIVGTLEGELILATELSGHLNHLPNDLLVDDDMSDAEKLECDGFVFFNFCPHCGLLIDPDKLMRSPEGSGDLHCPVIEDRA